LQQYERRVHIMQSSFAHRNAIRSFFSLLTFVHSFLPIGVAQERDALQTIKPEELVNSIGMKLVMIPAGEFQMGSTVREAAPLIASAMDEVPMHLVTTSHSFYMSVCEVTKGQFAEFVTDVGYKTDSEKHGGGLGLGSARTSRANGISNPTVRNDRYSWRQTGFFQMDSYPVVNVSWNDATAFCEWLSKKENRNYQLPTEAQWEYCCRAGTRTRYFNGDDANSVSKIGNVADQRAQTILGFHEVIRGNDWHACTAPVGRFPANSFGLRDMHGNVNEWCKDIYGKYWEEAMSDPVGSTEGSERVFRGGSWYSPYADSARCAARQHRDPSHCDFQIGFRVVMIPQPSATVE
jgi:formylglycine-generating enzyme required for sulfatase activity